jgi:signal transduction histidine kinase
VLFLLQWWVVNAAMRSATEQYMLSRLVEDAEVLLAALEFDAAGVATLDSKRIAPFYYRPFSGHYYRIDVGDAVIRSRSLWDEDLLLPSTVAESHEARRLPGPQQQTLLAQRRAYKKQAREILITTAEDLAGTDAQIAAFQWQYGMVTGCVLLLLVVLQAWIVKTGLRPIETVRQDVGRLERGEAAALRESVPQEIVPLVREINRLVFTLGQRLTRSRNAVGNLAHALKTPLAVLVRLADTPALCANPDVQGELKGQLAALRERLERELKRARLAGGGQPGRAFVFRDEIPSLLDTLKSIYRDKNLSFAVSWPAATAYPGDREDLLELLGNLLDNACKWARSQVSLTLLEDETFRFIVEDDGPGCPPEQLQRLLQRGVRVDESAAGHGLGLAIVSDIVKEYSGTLKLAASTPWGGLRVEVALPLWSPAEG